MAFVLDHHSLSYLSRDSILYLYPADDLFLRYVAVEDCALDLVGFKQAVLAQLTEPSGGVTGLVGGVQGDQALYFTSTDELTSVLPVVAEDAFAERHTTIRLTPQTS